MTDGLCWRSECRTGCYYPETCTEKLTAYKPPFEWPCDRRVAHGPHHVTWSQRHSEGTSAATTERGEFDCPGVKAHPATMIGGNYTKERSD